jgi:RHS repeat-associated protein
VESPGSSFAYSYDLAGNRTGVSVNGTPTASYSYDAADQVVGWGYDAAGNLLSDGATSYSYDALNHLTGASATGQDSNYTYNGDGTLVGQQVNGVSTSYVSGLAVSQGQILATTTGSTTTNYFYGSDIAPLASVKGSTRTWYGLDRQGSVRQTLDDAGNVLGTQNYDPYGQIESSSTLSSSFGYTGELRDATAGNEYLHARWYQPSTGQLLGMDPAVASTDQPYAYAADDPVNASDPTGQCITSDQDNLVGLEGGNGDCTHYIDAQLAQNAATAPLVEQDGVALDAGINQLLDTLGSSATETQIAAVLSKGGEFGEALVLDPGQLSAAQQQQLELTDVKDLTQFEADLNDPGSVVQAGVDAPTTGKGGVLIGICLGVLKLAKANPHVALGVLVVAGVVLVALLVYNRANPGPNPGNPRRRRRCGEVRNTQIIGGYCVGTHSAISGLPSTEKTDPDGVPRQAHHIIQDAAVNPSLENQGFDYTYGSAPAILLRGGTDGSLIPPVNPEHYLATLPQRNPCNFGFSKTWGTFGLERAIAYAGLRNANIPGQTARRIIAYADTYFIGRLHVKGQTPTDLPDNRVAQC